MLKADRTVKWLLGLIALFLGILALGPILRVTTRATAQSVTVQTPPADMVKLGEKVTDVASVAFDKDKTVHNVYVLDNAKCFIVQYSDHLQVYSISNVEVPSGTVLKSAPTGPQLILGR